MSKFYAIYYNPEKKNDSLVVVQEKAFNFWAAVFQIFWAMYYGVWYLVFLGLLLITPRIIFDPLSSLNIALNVLSFLCFGFFAGDFLTYHLDKSGYKLLDIVYAESYREAELRYYQKGFSSGI